MIRNLKMLGLALVAVFAMSSLVASAASASKDLFVAPEGTPVTLTGKQHNGNNKFILAGQAVECTTAEVNATVESTPLESVTTKEPKYGGCTYGGQAATVTVNECHYTLTGNTDANGHAKAHVKCPAGKSIHLTLNAIKCLITVAPQEAEEGYTITTTGAGATRELTLHITAKVKVTSHAHPSEGVTCASLTNGSGTLEGTFTVTGETHAGAHTGITDETVK